MKRLKLRKGRLLLTITSILFVILLMIFLPKGLNHHNERGELTLISFLNMQKEEIISYGKENRLKIEFQEAYHNQVKEGSVISQEPEEGSILTDKREVKVKISKGPTPISVYQNAKVNELGRVPIMMYHGIIAMKDNETKYTGGNVDKDGYNRTMESFRRDLDYYYENGYRMIRLMDYVEGNISTPLGYSPIILTFDDGREDNFKVLGKDENGLIIDPNCAVGILEEYKKKYPDFSVTATFFVNSGLFQQKEYDKEILNWLVDHGYDIGNHTTTHPDFTKINESQAKEAVAKVYQQLDEIIPGKYVPIVALPFGSPYKKTHANFSIILGGNYNEYTYQTKAALRVGWEAETSPFSSNFDATFLKRIRAYDNNGVEFDIKMAFDKIKDSRYISDGDTLTVVIPKSMGSKLSTTMSKQVITYE